MYAAGQLIGNTNLLQYNSYQSVIVNISNCANPWHEYFSQLNYILEFSIHKCHMSNYFHNQKQFDVGSCTTELCKCAAIINSEACLLFYVPKNWSIFETAFSNMLLGSYTEFPFLDSLRLKM